MAPSGGSEGEYALYVSGYMFQAMVTRLHSPRGRASKRRWSCSIILFKGQVAGNLEFLQACESDWKTFRDGEIAEAIHCMNKTDKAFRLIVLVQH